MIVMNSTKKQEIVNTYSIWGENMAITFQAWLNGIASAYNIDVNLIATSEAIVTDNTTGTPVESYLAFFNPPSFLVTPSNINIVSLNIPKSEITP